MKLGQTSGARARVVRSRCAIAALCLAACGDDRSSAAEQVSTVAGAAAESGRGGAMSLAGMDAPAPAGRGGMSAGAGRAAASAGQVAPAPAAGSGGAGGVAVAGQAGAGGMPAAAGASGMPAAGEAGAATPGGCTRELLKTTVDAYFEALAARDPMRLPLAAAVKFTENGETLELGQGLWATAGAVKFKESLFDADACGTVTQAVVPDGSTDIPLAVRLELEAQKITEIETIAVREGDYFVASNTRNMIALMSDPWEAIVPEADRQTREQLEGWIDKYFRMFPMGGCNLADDCNRMENGFALACDVGATCSTAAPSGMAVMTPRSILADVEAGLAAGFVMFQGRYTDVHMIKYAAGEVRGVHTILGEATSSGWD